MGVEWKSRDAVIEEPGRRIVQEQTRTGGQALPWLDMTAFLRGAIDLAQSHRYHSRIFLAPPWPEIYVQDEERRHSMDEARAEFERLQRTYPALGYAVSRLPKIRVAQRADFVLDTLASR